MLVPVALVSDSIHSGVESRCAVRRGRPGEDLDPNTVRIEGEERVVVFAVFDVVVPGRRLDLAAGGDAASVRLLDLVRTINFERNVLDFYLVVTLSSPSAGRRPNPCAPYSR
jgi:hypothetical protein